MTSLCYVILFALLSSSMILGCEAVRPTKVPMDTLYYKDAGINKNRTLLVMLHGRGGSAADFEKEGFVGEVKRQGLNVDMVAVEAHMDYYINREIVIRLKDDVIKPAQSAGYNDIILVGVSMGGLGAILYSRAYPKDVHDTWLIAPYLGEDHIIDEISRAGGLNKWTPGRIEKDDWERDLWAWLKEYASKPKNIEGVYLVYGLEDRFAPTHRLLADVLPEKHVFEGKGGHDWSTWRGLWPDLIKKAGSPGRPN